MIANTIKVNKFIEKNKKTKQLKLNPLINPRLEILLHNSCAYADKAALSSPLCFLKGTQRNNLFFKKVTSSVSAGDKGDYFSEVTLRNSLVSG